LTAALSGMLTGGLMVASTAAKASSSRLSGTPILLGNVSSDTGSQGFPGYDPLVPDTLAAWASWTNAHGGVNGHPVKIISLDDKGDAAQSVADAKTLISKDHVVAMIGINDPGLDTDWASYAQKAGVPVIGGTNNTVDPWSTNPDFFLNTSTSVLGDAEVFPLLGKQLGAKSFGIVLCTLAVCAEFMPYIKAGAKTEGIKFAYGALAPAEAPNYTANCLAAQSAGVQAMLPTGIEVGEFVANCTTLGYHPIYILGTTDVYNSYLAALSSAKEVAAPGPDFPYFYKGPQTKDFDAAMKKYAASIPNGLLGETQAAEWVSGLMFQKAVELSGAKGIPTSAEIINGLYKFKNQTLGGLAPPLTFTRSAGNSPEQASKTPQCFFVMSFDKGKPRAPQGLKVSCAKPVKG
jgi:branched-chain amino acid transport system substrate-binding protein